MNRSRSTNGSVLIGGMDVQPAETRMADNQNIKPACEILIDFNSDYSPAVVYEIHETITYSSFGMKATQAP